ncbi:N-acetylmuramoyl-L-alanine amidase [Jannaschia sp. LMIT008]|uniref:N-acetylmuramoyl-L-alanine amidase n=1 Tax=Jannaschia maritima TaxID=3032585 RepID=UPI00281207E2|nr:N-acetylmuramoyl-L-alanine amidase [Jannaschia sp. LMIT008]
MVPSLIVLHYTAMAGLDPVVRWFGDPATELSAHYVVGGDGTVVVMVPEDRRAWHAGAGSWMGCADVNSASVGIELCNRGDHPFAAAQMAALRGLLRGIMDRHGIGPAGVIGHSDLAPGRKIDPGARFDWRGLARSGLAVWPRAAPREAPDPARFRDRARRFGYTAGVPDAALLAAVRLRFRPGAGGPLDGDDMAVAAGLIDAAPLLG